VAGVIVPSPSRMRSSQLWLWSLAKVYSKMHRGYIKVWRKIVDAGWLQNHKLCAFWLWCLIKASHKEFDAIVGCQTVKLMPGEFVFGLKVASKELKITIQSIRTLLDFLKTTQNLTIKSTNKFSVITITNWNTYQIQENEINTQSNKPLTNKQQTTNNIQECKEHKNVKKVFIIPTLSEIKSYCAERKNTVDAQFFLDKYIGNGWMVGNAKMKDWKAVVRTWEKNNFSTGGNNGNKFNAYKPNSRELSKDESDAYDAITREYEATKTSSAMADN